MAGGLSWIARTMLIERLAGVGAYVLVVLIGYVFLRNAKDYRTVNRTLNVVLLALGVMAFFFLPDPSKDLYRWLVIAEDWKGMSFEQFFAHHLSTSMTPIAYFMIYASVNTGFSGVLPLLCALIFYANIFHIIKDMYRRFQPTNEMVALSFLSFMVSGAFLEVISGVRCFVALSICARCIYDDLVAEKSFFWRLPLYLIACLIHSAALPVFIVRIVFYLFLEQKNRVTRLIETTVVVVVTIGFALFYGQSLIDNMFGKAQEYLFGDMYSYVWEYIIGAMQWFMMAYTMFHLRGEYKNASKGMQQLSKFLVLFLAINLVFIVEYNLFHRFLVVSAAMFIPYLANIQFDVTSVKYRSLRQRVFWMCLLIFAIVCARGNLCGYKFFLMS